MLYPPSSSSQNYISLPRPLVLLDQADHAAHPRCQRCPLTGSLLQIIRTTEKLHEGQAVLLFLYLEVLACVLLAVLMLMPTFSHSFGMVPYT